MKIVRLSIDDIIKCESKIVSLLKQSFEKSFPKKFFSDNTFQDRVESLKEYLGNNQAVVYGCINNGELIGFIWFFEKDKETIHINHFVIDEKYRGLGVGKILLNFVENYATNNKLSNIELFVTKDNESAVHFYNKRDFKVERYLMSKRLL